MGTTSSTSSAGFTGTSSFSTDLQQVITRAVGIASLPITQLQNQQSTLTTQQGELQTLGTQFQSVQSSLDAINSALGSGSYSAAVDNQTVASAALSTGALAGTYSVTVGSIGSHANTISSNLLTTVSDPSSGNISTSSAFTLTVDNATFSIADPSNSLNGLVKAINSSGANVQATLVNVGGSAAPDYRLSIQGAGYAPTAIQLNDGNNDLLNTLGPPGSYVTYQVNGLPATPVNSTTRSLPISTGLTVNVLQTGTANVTVSQNANAVQNTLTSFVNAFNSAVDELTKSRGQNGGALAGQSVVGELSDVLHTLTNYSSSSTGSVNSIADLGLTFDQNGHLQFDSSVFSQAASNSLSNVQNFLGSETGGGFLATAFSALTGATDPTSGLITEATESIGTTITNLTAKISSEQDRVTLLQTNLTQQMAQADAAISSLQQQATQITNLFAAMQQASKNITG